MPHQPRILVSTTHLRDSEGKSWETGETGEEFDFRKSSYQKHTHRLTGLPSFPLSRREWEFEARANKLTHY